MIALSKATYDKIMRAVRYPSITGGRGVRATRMPGGGVRLDLDLPNDGNGFPWNGPPPPEDVPGEPDSGGTGGGGGPSGTVHSAAGPADLPASPPNPPFNP